MSEPSPAIALMRLLIETEDADRVGELLDAAVAEVASLPADAAARRRAVELHQLFHANRAGCTRIAAMLTSGVDTGTPAASIDEGIAFCTRLFDWSVRQSEEASVALYSLGNPQLLDQATAEIVTLLEQWNVLGPDRTILQIGCGIGRVERALAQRVREAYGIDVSANMIEVARRRCADFDNVRLSTCSGRDLAAFEAATLDLVYSVDAFPYLYQSGMALVETHFREVARVLKGSGHFVILNFSYRGDAAADRRDVGRLAAETGFEVLVDGTTPFTLWNGLAFQLRLQPRAS